MRRAIARDQNKRKQAVSSQVSTWVNFNPLSLSPLLWLDASDTITITESGGAVSQIDDKSGNGRHFTQSTSANQPETGTRTVQGLNVLDMVPGEYLTYDAGSDAIDMSPMTLFVVSVYDGASPGRTAGTPFSARRSANGSFTYQSPNFLYCRNNVQAVSSYVSGTVLPNISYTNGETVIYEIKVTGSTSFHRVNGGTESSASTSAPADMRYLRIGADIGSSSISPTANSLLDGAWCEALLFNAELSDDNRRLVRKYLGSKWGVVV